MGATPDGGMLRDDLLASVCVAVARAPSRGGEFAEAAARACAGAGAAAVEWPVVESGPGADELVVPAGVRGAHVLVVDAAGFYAHALGREGRDGLIALRACLDTAWRAIRALVEPLAAAGPGAAGGRVICLAPPDGGGPHADAARAALENLARTLSVEWARKQITCVAVAPGRRTTAREVGALVAYLCSPAGAYFSGCQFDLRGPAPAHA